MTIPSSSPQVLYADNDQLTRELVTAFLSKSGLHVHAVDRAESAVSQLRQKKFDLVLSDFSIADSLQLLRQIRQENPGQAVIFMTGVGSIQECVALLREGAADIVQKPIDFDSLGQSINRILSSAQQKSFNKKLYEFAVAEKASYVFSTAHIGSVKVPLRLLEHLFVAGKLDLQEKLKLELAFQEAFTNSVEHGNLELQSTWKEEFDATGLDRYSEMKRQRLLDPKFSQRVIELDTEYHNDWLVISIRDQGPGFELASCTGAKEPAIKSHGRGLTLIEAAVDRVKYSEGGRRITLEKRLK